MGESFSIKTKNVRNIEDGILLQCQGIEALRNQVEEINASYRDVGSYTYDITRKLNAIAQRLGEQGKNFKDLSDKLEEIVTRYEKTEKAIREGSVYSEDGLGQGNITPSGGVPDDVNGLDDLLNMLNASGNMTKGAGWLTSILQWLKDLEKISSNGPFDKINNGLTIGGLLLTIAADTLENIKNGESLNAIIADILSETAMTLGEWAIQAGCKTIGMAIGSTVPVVGTAVGGVIGDAVGLVAAEAFDFAMNYDFDGDGNTAFDGMSGKVEGVLDKLIPDGREPLSFAGA